MDSQNRPNYSGEEHFYRPLPHAPGDRLPEPRLGVDGNRFQLFVGSIAREVRDPEFAFTTAICIAFGQKEFLMGLVSATILSSITISNFSYQKM